MGDDLETAEYERVLRSTFLLLAVTWLALLTHTHVYLPAI